MSLTPTALGAITIDMSGAVFYEKDPDSIYNPMSTTKCMTAYLVYKHNISHALQVTVREGETASGTTMGLQVGDIVTVRDLLYGLMLPSGNDAGRVLARLVGEKLLPGEGGTGDSLDRHLQEMNDQGEAWGWGQGFVFTDPSGYPDTQTRLTARQVADMWRRCVKDYPDLDEIAGTRTHTATITGPNARTRVLNHTIKPDGTVPFPEYISGKTGGIAGANPARTVVIHWEDPATSKKYVSVVLATPEVDPVRYNELRAQVDEVMSSPVPGAQGLNVGGKVPVAMTAGGKTVVAVKRGGLTVWSAGGYTPGPTVPPQTGWEATGSRTTISEERAFLYKVAADTDVHLQSMGKTVEGRDMWRADIGNPNGVTIFVAGSQHGFEPAGREGALMFLRDIAYPGRSPVAENFLAENRIVVMPNMNPDGSHAWQRANANGVDLNRHWFTIPENEHKAARSTMVETRPHIILDLHEWGTDYDFVFAYYGGGTANSHANPAINSATLDMVDFTVNGIEAAGHKTHPYPEPTATVSRAVMSVAGIPWNAIAYLTETRSRAVLADRIEAQRQFLHLSMEWALTNKNTIMSAVQSSVNDSINGTSPLMIPLDDDGTRGAWTEVPDPGSYTIPEGVAIPHEVLEANGIEIVGRTISTKQRYRGLVPILFDPQSFDRII